MSVSYSHWERKQTYTSIRRILEHFERDDRALAHMTHLAQADGYGSGGDGGGRSKGDHSDPTVAAVTARTDGTDDASRAFAQLQVALIEFGKAEVLLRRALPADGATEQKPRPQVDAWCTSCNRVKLPDGSRLLELRNTQAGGRRDLCRWCCDEWLASGDAGKRQLPDERLILARHFVKSFGGHLTTAKRQEWMRLSLKEARKRCFGVQEQATA